MFTNKYDLFQAWSQCFCTNVTSSDNFVPRPLTYCDMPCNGNSSEVCGGSWSLSVYKIGEISVIQGYWMDICEYLYTIHSTQTPQKRTIKTQRGKEKKKKRRKEKQKFSTFRLS